MRLLLLAADSCKASNTSGCDRCVAGVVGHLIAQGLLKRRPCLTALDVGVEHGKFGYKVGVPYEPQHGRHKNALRREARDQVVAPVEPGGECAQPNFYRIDGSGTP